MFVKKFILSTAAPAFCLQMDGKRKASDAAFDNPPVKRYAKRTGVPVKAYAKRTPNAAEKNSVSQSSTQGSASSSSHQQPAQPTVDVQNDAPLPQVSDDASDTTIDLNDLPDDASDTTINLNDLPDDALSQKSWDYSDSLTASEIASPPPMPPYPGFLRAPIPLVDPNVLVPVSSPFHNVEKHADTGDWQQAEAELNRVQNRYGLQMDVTAYNLMMKACRNACNFDRAEYWFGQLQASSAHKPDLIAPNVDSYNILIRMYSAAGNMDRAYFWLRAMFSNPGLSPNDDTYFPFIGAYLRTGNFSFGQTKSLLNDFVAAGYQPRADSYLPIIRWYAEHKFHESTFNWLANMEHMGVQPDIRVFKVDH